MMHSRPDQLPPTIEQYLRKFVRARRRMALLRAGGAAASIAILWLLVWGLVDRLSALSPITRAILLVLLLAAVVALLAGPVAMMFRRRIDLLAAARQVEMLDLRFNEALATVVSQSLSQPAARGSDQLLEQLSRQVESILHRKEPRRHEETKCSQREDPSQPFVKTLSLRGLRGSALVPRGSVIRAWSLAAMLAIGAVLLSVWSWLDLPRLVARQLAPAALIAPATTTHLLVMPGSTQLVQGDSVTIVARVDSADPPSDGATLRLSSDGGKSFSSIDMTPNSDSSGERYVATLDSLSRDMLYEVAAGDAVAGPFHLHARARPVVREFRIGLSYSSQSGRAPATLRRSDGSFMAPPGTYATITVVANEPLKQAWFTIGGMKIQSSATDDPHARQVQTVVNADAQYSVEMLSESGVSGTGPQGMMIRVAPPIATRTDDTGAAAPLEQDALAPPEYQQALQAYFQALERTSSEGSR